MAWWQILLVFVGIPAGLFALITVAVLTFAEARVPDGIVRATAAVDDADRGDASPAGD